MNELQSAQACVWASIKQGSKHNSVQNCTITTSTEMSHSESQSLGVPSQWRFCRRTNCFATGSHG